MESSVILLAGGFGTRVQALHPTVPKPLIPVCGSPFLEWVLEYWKQQGVHRAVISLGHLANVAEAHFANRPADILTIYTVQETTPLGTGGAVRYAAANAPITDPFFVANADSLVLAPVAPALDLMRQNDADAVVLGVHMDDTSRYGSLGVASDGKLLGFREKESRSGMINAGVYLFRRRVLDRFPPHDPLSMETEVFPTLIAEGARIYVAPVSAPFLDMGTPQGLAEVDSFIQAHFSRAAHAR